MLFGVWQDAVYGLRQLRRKPVFSLLAVTTLALGIGANTALYSVVRTVVLEPLPYHEVDRLVRIWGINQGELSNISPLDFLDWQRNATAFPDVAAFTRSRRFLYGSGDPELVVGAEVSPSFLTVLRLSPAWGRDFVVQDADPTASPVVILGHGLWQSRFGADTAIVGASVSFGSAPHTVIGVLPTDFLYPDPNSMEQPDFLVPLRIDPERHSRGGHWLRAIGRLAPGVTLAVAQTEMDAISTALAAQYPVTNTDWGVRLFGLHDSVVGDHRLGLFVLLGAVGVLLLIACVNVANLALARGVSRHSELAIRTALGADRFRIVRQLVVESLMLALVGGLAGLLVATVTLESIFALAPSQIPRLSAVRLDGPALGFAMSISVIAGLLVGLVPALRVSQVDVQATINVETRSSSAGTRQRFMQGGLVVAQIGLATGLLAGAGLLLKSFWHLQHVDPGFQTAGLLKARVFAPSSRFEESAQLSQFFIDLESRLAALPGVESVGGVQTSPLSGSYSCNSFVLNDRPDFPLDKEPCVEERVATPGYFSAMGIALLSGEVFSRAHTVSGEMVAVINEAFARKHWPNGSPIGTGFSWGTREEANWRTIIGVVSNVRHFGLGEEVQPEVYLPHAQYPYYRGVTMFLRSNVAPAALIASVRAEVAAVAGAVPVYDVATMESVVSRSLATDRFQAVLLAAFATLAFVLAFAGVYGVVAYTVGTRTKEFGVRIALGATSQSVVRLVLGWSVRLAVLGLAVGGALTLALAGSLRALLYDVSPRDPFTLGAVVVLVTAAALLGSYLPARRAAQVDPVTSMRAE